MCSHRHTGVSVRAEVASPLDESASFSLTAGDGVAADGADNRGVAKSGLGGDDRVGDVVVDGRVLLLLDLNDGAVLEVPLDNVGLVRGTLGVLALVQCAPKLGEVLQLDEVPDVRQRGCTTDMSVSNVRSLRVKETHP